MDTTSRRWFPLAAAAVVVAAVAFATCRRDDAPPAPPGNTAPGGDTTPGTRRPRHDPGAGGAAKGAGGAVGEPSEHGPIPEDDGYPFVDVEVVGHDGRAASNAAIVYALPAGRTTESEPPNANVEGGRCRLHVLRAGRYDVGAVDGAFAALAQDVDVPRAGPLRITLPEPAAVLLVGDPPLVPDDAAWPGADFRATADGERFASWPGRGQQVAWIVPGRVEQSTRRIDLVVPKGAAGRVRFGSRDVAATPGTFTAPATLRVVRAGRFPLVLRLAFDPPGVSFPRGAVLRAEFRVGDVAEPTATWRALLAGNESIDAAVGRPVLVRADANVPDGTIRWQGEGIAPGSQPFGGLVRDAENVVDLTLRLATAAPDASSPVAPGASGSVTVSGGDGAGVPPEVRVFFCDVRGVVAAAEQAPGTAAKFSLPGDGWALAARGGWAADPLRLAAGAGPAAASMTLRPGGWLVLTPVVRPPASLGEVSLRRHDGAPILCQDGAQAVPSVRADRGALLGPFPEGSVEFDLVLCDEVVGTARGTVRAGAREKLKIPSLAPPR